MASGIENFENSKYLGRSSECVRERSEQGECTDLNGSSSVIGSDGDQIEMAFRSYAYEEIGISSFKQYAASQDQSESKSEIADQNNDVLSITQIEPLPKTQNNTPIRQDE